MAIKNDYFPYYDPSVAGASIVCALFSIGFVMSAYQTIRHKSWIWIVMLLAIAMEAVGFGARIGAANDHTNRILYIVQFCLVILAPVFMAGIIYVAFGRILFLVVPAEHRTVRTLWVPARWLTPIFVGFDILSLFLQLIGAVMISSTQATDKNASSKLQRGRDIALVGVTVQIVAFGLFSVIAARFHFVSRRFDADLERRFRSAPAGKAGKTLVTVDGNPYAFRPQWRRLLYGVNFTCILIIIRSIFREIDFAQGKEGYTKRNEWCEYVLDALPMLLLVATYNLVPPGAYVAMGFRQQRNSAPQQSPSRDSESYPMEPSADVQWERR